MKDSLLWKGNKRGNTTDMLPIWALLFYGYWCFRVSTRQPLSPSLFLQNSMLLLFAQSHFEKVEEMGVTSLKFLALFCRLYPDTQMFLSFSLLLISLLGLCVVFVPYLFFSFSSWLSTHLQNTSPRHSSTGLFLLYLLLLLKLLQLPTPACRIQPSHISIQPGSLYLDPCLSSIAALFFSLFSSAVSESCWLRVLCSLHMLLVSAASHPTYYPSLRESHISHKTQIKLFLVMKFGGIWFWSLNLNTHRPPSWSSLLESEDALVIRITAQCGYTIISLCR